MKSFKSLFDESSEESLEEAVKLSKKDIQAIEKAIAKTRTSEQGLAAAKKAGYSEAQFKKFLEIMIGESLEQEEVVEEKGTHKTKDGRTAKKGLWYNINQKKKRGEKPNPPGHPDRPSSDDFEAARKTTKEEVEDELDENRYSPLQQARLKKEREDRKKREAGSGSQAQRMKKKQYGGMMGGLKKEEQELDEKKYVVKYTNPNDKKSGRTSGPLSRKAAELKAAMGNKVDKVGGKYTVIPFVEEVELDELKTTTLRSYRKKAIDAVASGKKAEKRAKGVERSSMKIRRQEFNDLYKKESAELEEMDLSKHDTKKLLQFHRKYADKRMSPSDANTVKAVRRELMKRGVSLNEEVELDEAFEIQTAKHIDDAGEDKALSYGRKKGYKEAGVIGQSPIKAMVLFKLRPEDKGDLKGANIQSGEQVFRYATRQTVAGDIFPLIKVNFNKGMVYFLTQESSSGEIDQVKFENRGMKLKFARMLSGMVEQVELDEGAFKGVGKFLAKRKFAKNSKQSVKDAEKSLSKLNKYPFYDVKNREPHEKDFIDKMKKSDRYDRAAKRLNREEVELDEAVYRKGDTVQFYTGEIKNNRPVESKGKVVSSNKKETKINVSGKIHTVDNEKIRGAIEETDLKEAKGTGVKKFVRGMRVANVHNPNKKGTVIKGGDNLKKSVEVEWDSGTTTMASGKYLMSIKKNESVDLGEAKISVGDRVTLKPNKNTLDRSLIGKAGVVTGMVGSKPTVKFANGKTIAVSASDLKMNESVELDEASYPLASKWQSGAKVVKKGKVELTRGSGGVHSIKVNGKSVGDFSLDDDSGMWVTNVKGKKGQGTYDEIDDIVNAMMKESVEIEDQDLIEYTDWDWDALGIAKALTPITHKKYYAAALKDLKSVLDRKKKETSGRLRHSPLYYAAQISKQYKGVDTKMLAKMLGEEYEFEEEIVVDEALDPVNPKAVKKDFEDRKDKDIDNDGDTDDSDEYLHKRRKAISKSIKKKKQENSEMKTDDEKLSGKAEKVTTNPKIDNE